MIKTKKRNLNRLLKIARYVGKQDLNILYMRGYNHHMCSKADCDIEHFSWFLKELPIVFKQWSYKAGEIPSLDKHEKLSSLAATASFFNLTGDELFHLFVPNYQNPIYGGKDLDFDASASDLINNIYQFILYQENMLELPGESDITNYKSLIKNKNYYEQELSKPNIVSKLSA